MTGSQAITFCTSLACITIADFIRTMNEFKKNPSK
jgi:hypothetical protein